MDISSISSQAVDNTELLAAVKCIKAAQSSMMAIGSIIEDTAEISAEAMARYRAEQE